MYNAPINGLVYLILMKENRVLIFPCVCTLPVFSYFHFVQISCIALHRLLYYCPESTQNVGEHKLVWLTEVLLHYYEITVPKTFIIGVKFMFLLSIISKENLSLTKYPADRITAP